MHRRLLVVALLALAVLAPVGTAALAYGNVDTRCTGTVTDRAVGVTVVSVQGTKFEGHDGPQKKPASLIGVGPYGQIQWVHRWSQGTVWSYDVDPLANGNLFMTTTIRGDTVVFEYDPVTGERVWEKQFDALDTHDADLLPNGDIVLANMRNADEEAGTNGDRIYVYNRSQDRITWQWRFSNHFNESVGGSYTDDWTHVNDVDLVGDDKLLLSPRNFDQVLLINMTTKEVELVLGEYKEHSILKKQHNPDHLEGENGTPTFLVGDSDNDRIVEYAFRNGSWERTWTLGEGQFDWPRDADRLPNGNTLITDSRNHRVIEVTPNGTIVWEVYTPWLPYDAERVRWGDSSRGPTIAEQNMSGTYDLKGSSNKHESLAALEDCGTDLADFSRSTAKREFGTPAPTTSEGTPATVTTPTWTASPSSIGGTDDLPGQGGVSIPGFGLLLGVLALVGLVGMRYLRR